MVTLSLNRLESNLLKKSRIKLTFSREYSSDWYTRWLYFDSSPTSAVLFEFTFNKNITYAYGEVYVSCFSRGKSGSLVSDDLDFNNAFLQRHAFFHLSDMKVLHIRSLVNEGVVSFLI